MHNIKMNTAPYTEKTPEDLRQLLDLASAGTVKDLASVYPETVDKAGIHGAGGMYVEYRDGSSIRLGWSPNDPRSAEDQPPIQFQAPKDNESGRGTVAHQVLKLAAQTDHPHFK